jgi:hypothetical protein
MTVLRAPVTVTHFYFAAPAENSFVFENTGPLSSRLAEDLGNLFQCAGWRVAQAA